jgi:glycosyltransferase involved in cell wall biosynthesis
MYCFSQARGKYIALCDGDDYWTNKYKIQKQVAFLEANEEYSYCGHKSKSKSNSDINKISLNLQEFGFKELLQKNFLNTSTLMFRQDSIKDLPAIFKNVPAGDWYLQLFAIKNSKAYVLPDYMSVYRLHEKGIWSNLNKREQCLNGVKTLEALKQLYNDKESIVLINEAIESRKKDFGIIERSRIEKILLKINRIRIFNWINFRLK